MKPFSATSSSKLYVRSAGERDRTAVQQLVAEVLREFGVPAGPCGEQDTDIENMGLWYPPPKGCFEVIQNGQGKILGCGGIHPLDDETCELRKLYFLPELRGQGFGAALLDRFVKFAGQVGYQRMILETASVLHAAIAMYRRRGFVEIPGKTDIARCDRAFELTLSDYRAPKHIINLEVLNGDH